MGAVYKPHVRDEKFVPEKLNRVENLDDLIVSGRIILKCIINNKKGVCTLNSSGSGYGLRAESCEHRTENRKTKYKIGRSSDYERRHFILRNVSGFTFLCLIKHHAMKTCGKAEVYNP
jgi:hypothetical protein